MMHSRIRPGPRAGLMVVAILLMTLCFASVVSAHESREVGDYQITIGFLNEPAIIEEPNGLDLRVARIDGEEPVDGLAETLQAEVIYGDQSMSLELRPAFGQPGAYQSNFIPTAEGAYTFHITGTIEDMEIDETFISGPDTFAEVASRTAMSFPNEVGPVGDVAETASDASDSADSAQMLSIVAIVIGLLGLVAGGVAIALNRRSAPSATSRSTAHEASV